MKGAVVITPKRAGWELAYAVPTKAKRNETKQHEHRSLPSSQPQARKRKIPLGNPPQSRESKHNFRFFFIFIFIFSSRVERTVPGTVRVLERKGSYRRR